MKPIIYSLEEHKIPFTKIDKHAYYVIEKLRQEGFIAYLVGGSVRDLLLQLSPKDFDITTSAKPEEIRRLFSNCILIGRRFRLAQIRFGRKILEVATFRAGDPDDSSLIIRDNIWGNPEEDVLRRDFTINGLFYNPENQTIIDYVGGFTDVEKKILRTIGKPEVRFQQDPVRMIRLIKFHARFNFQIEEETYQALVSCKLEIKKSSQARILEELLRMLESGYSETFFHLLKTHGIFSLLFPHPTQPIEIEKKIYEYLQQVDHFHRKHPFVKLDRAVLLSCLLFPIFEQKLLSFPGAHLGIVTEKAQQFITEFFHPFFKISHRIRISLTSILVHQYRILPQDRSTVSRMKRIPKDPCFYLALEFFQLRSQMDPTLVRLYTEWHSVFLKNPHRKKRNDSF
ncbi:MAG: polynucleotide adenylyltransferase PcnB [Chlamydiota bacterium]